MGLGELVLGVVLLGSLCNCVRGGDGGGEKECVY